MRIELWAAVVVLIIIASLFFSNRSKKGQIERLISSHEYEKETLNKEILSLKEAVSSGEILNNTSKKGPKEIEALRAEIAKQTIASQSRYSKICQKYNKLMLAYMFARKKSEVEAIEEIEQSILSDYEELGSRNISATSYIASAMADFYTCHIQSAENELKWMGQLHRSERIADVRKDAALLIERAKNCQYAFELALVRLLADHPEIEPDYIGNRYGVSLETAAADFKRDAPETAKYLQQISELTEKCMKLEAEIEDHKSFMDIRWPLLRDSALDYKKEFSSNLTAIPYMSRIIADIMTIDFDRLAWSLSWGNNQERKKKVASLTVLKKEKAEEIERIKGAEYQLAYLLELYPVLQDVIDAEFSELEISYDQITDFDPTRKYMERTEWEALSTTERNQLALDRYVESRKKSKWQVGRDYELYCGYCYEKKGFIVDYYGSFHGLDDLGRDLIVKKGNNTKIVQCKYWSKTKQIHENHVMQLYGSMIEYNLKKNQTATATLITNITLSEKAKAFAHTLGIEYMENVPLGDFPRIKCNIGVNEEGKRTKIYHLPFDQQYDVTKVDGENEFMAFTVAEAEAAGFRRAYKWHTHD